MERVQRGNDGDSGAYGASGATASNASTAAVQTHLRSESKEKKKKKKRRAKRNYKVLQRKYNDLQKETMRRQIAHDIHIEILVKEHSVRESLFTHAISELERKLSAFTNSQ